MKLPWTLRLGGEFRIDALGIGNDMAVLKTDLDLTTKDLAGLTSPDALAAFLSRLGYDTSRRTVLTPSSLGLSGDTATSIRSIELLSEDEDGFLRVLFVQPKSLTAKVRNDLIRIIGKSNEDYLVVLAATFDTLEFVLLDKKTKEQAGPGGGYKVQVVPKIFSIDRRKPSPQDVRTLRQFTWTHQDALDQFDKLRVVFDNAIFTGEFFQNRGLFSDYFLRERLKEDTAWRENPSSVFQQVRNLYQDAQSRWHAKGRAEITSQLLKPVFGHLGFLPLPQSASAGVDDSKPDFFLKDPTGARNLSAAFVYPWGRWLDGPDFQDPDHPDENPGARVVAAIEEGHADWAIVTNGRLWRLYSRQAHARSTNFYEVDLIEALNVSGETDPNEAFRYWWLFFRSAAFQKDASGESCWLDGILQGSRDYAKRLGDRLKERIFITIFPHLAEGFLADRRARLGLKGKPTPEELSDVYEATLTLLYRLLFLLYAESRDLLPVREGPYGEASLKKIKEEIAAKAGVALDDANALLEKAYSDKDTVFYDRLCTLFKAMDKGDPVLNVPTYNGGLFNTAPDATDDRDQRIARFLRDHRVPDRLPGQGDRPTGQGPGREDPRARLHRLQVARSASPGLDLRRAPGVQAQGRRRRPDDPDREEPGEIHPALRGQGQAGQDRRGGRRERQGVPLERQGRAESLRGLLHSRPDRGVHRRSDGRSDSRREARSPSAGVPQGPAHVRE